MSLLGIFSIISTCFQGIKEATTPTLTAEHWANKELQHKDRMSGMSESDILKNAQRGRYYVSKDVMQAYPVPHREPDGKHRIIIENCELHKADVAQYGAYQAQKWVEQGKYNLNAAELEITHLQFELKTEEMYSLVTGMNPERKAKIERIKQTLATKHWDYRNTEALKQWEKARAADPRNI